MLAFKALLLALLASPVWAKDAPLTGAEFDAFVTGHAFAYARGGQTFGTEAYRTQQRVIWMGTDGICLAGAWIAQADQICFIYDIDGTGIPRVCAPIYAAGAGLRAVENDGTEVIGAPVAMPDLSACHGPEVGA